MSKERWPLNEVSLTTERQETYTIQWRVHRHEGDSEVYTLILEGESVTPQQAEAIAEILRDPEAASKESAK